jgi:hypothetical protein
MAQRHSVTPLSAHLWPHSQVDWVKAAHLLPILAVALGQDQTVAARLVLVVLAAQQGLALALAALVLSAQGASLKALVVRDAPVVRQALTAGIANMAAPVAAQAVALRLALPQLMAAMAGLTPALAVSLVVPAQVHPAMRPQGLLLAARERVAHQVPLRQDSMEAMEL